MLKFKINQIETTATSFRASADAVSNVNDFSRLQSSNADLREREWPRALGRTRGLVCGVILLFALVLGSFGVAAHETNGVSTNSLQNGLTARFEIHFLKTTIDHHFAALRMTELAAGTDPTRDADLTVDEGTSPTPGTNATPVTAKSTLDEIKSLARQGNRTAREEILKAQRLLRQWYGIEHEPQISEVAEARIQILEVTPAGDEFNHVFLEVFSRHRFTITLRAVEAITSSDLDHEALRRLARNILETGMNDINEMRELLCEQFDFCDFQPYVGIKGRHTGDEEELDESYSRFDDVTADEDEDGGKHQADPTPNGDDSDDGTGEDPTEDPVNPVQPVQPVRP